MSTVRDVILRSLEDVGVVGVGQTPLAEDMNFGLSRFNAMIGQFNRRRWLVYHTIDVACLTTGLNVYSVGTNGNFAIPRPDQLEDGCYFRQYFSGSGAINSNRPVVNGDFNSDFNSDFSGQASQIVSQPNGSAIDYPLTLLQSREDWNRIALKNMPSWPAFVYYDPAYTQLTTGGVTLNGVTNGATTAPNGFLYINPVPAAGQFELHILVKDVLSTYADLSTVLSSPPEYEEFFEFQLALRFCLKYQISAPPELVGLARAASATIRSANTQVPQLQLPSALQPQGQRYNVFSDRRY